MTLLRIAEIYFGLVFIGALIYVILVWIDVEVETKQAPKIPMFTCNKHGIVPTHLCVTFNEHETPGALQERHCPFCFEDAFGKAAQALASKETERKHL